VEDSGTGHESINADELKKKVEEAKNLNAHPLKNIGLRGRGLAQIVSNWTDELYFEDAEDGGIRVRAIKYISNEDANQSTQYGFVNINKTLVN